MCLLWLSFFHRRRQEEEVEDGCRRAPSGAGRVSCPWCPARGAGSWDPQCAGQGGTGQLGPTLCQAVTAGWDPALQFSGGGGGKEMGTPPPMPPRLQVPISPWDTHPHCPEHPMEPESLR